jgi:hypothetical protein
MARRKVAEATLRDVLQWLDHPQAGLVRNTVGARIVRLDNSAAPRPLTTTLALEASRYVNHFGALIDGRRAEYLRSGR